MHTRTAHPARARHPLPLRRAPPPPTTRASAPRSTRTRYDYDGAVLWQAHAGALWARFTIALRRALAAALGVRAREFREHARLSYAKVAEYQRRGLVHFHAVIRLDGPDGPADPPPAGLDLDRAAGRDHRRRRSTRAAHRRTARRHTAARSAGARSSTCGEVTAAARAQIEDDDGEITDAALAGYIAKYATKGTGATEGADRPIRDIAHVEHLRLADHHRRMITTAWELGGRDALRRAATCGAGRTCSASAATSSPSPTATPPPSPRSAGERRTWRLLADLAQLDPTPTTTTRIPPDLDTITVINDWWPVHYGHRDDAERELAAAIAERHRTTTASRSDEKAVTTELTGPDPADLHRRGGRPAPQPVTGDHLRLVHGTERFLPSASAAGG